MIAEQESVYQQASEPIGKAVGKNAKQSFKGINFWKKNPFLEREGKRADGKTVFQPSAMAILIRERSEISPLLSNLFREPRLTPESSLSFCCDIFRFFRMARTLSEMSFSISGGVFCKKGNRVIIDHILTNSIENYKL